MNEKYRPQVQDVEESLGIGFIEPRQELLNHLNIQLEQISAELGVPFIKPQIPEKGFLPYALSDEQQKSINQLLEQQYADSAVELQDNLTVIPINENSERMVSLPSLFNESSIPLSLSSLPFHEACGEWGGKPRVFWARETVAERILKCGKALDSIGIMLHIEDAFRPSGVQEGLFLRRAKMILQQHPDWINSWDKVWNEARSKTAISPLMAGHKSGAALDMTLRRKSDGSPLPLGNVYPEGGPKVALHYPYVTQEEWTTRKLFTLTMEMGGLRNYPYETWHASYGDLSAGIAPFSTDKVTSNYTAVYGPIESFDPLTGAVQPSPRETISETFYKPEELLRLIGGNN